MGIKETLLNYKLVANFVNNRVALKQYLSNQDICNRLKTYKDIQKGKRCFIIGTGPSLRIEDLDTLRSKNEITFGSNRIYELFDKTKWRPTYYMNQDHTLIKATKDKISAMDIKVKFLPVEFINDFPENNGFEYFVLKHKEYYPHNAEFSSEVSEFVGQGFTVTYGAIQMAIYMGFSEIYLLGIDHNYTVIRDSKGNIKRNDANKNYAKGMENFKGNLPRVEESTIAYETARKYADRYGIKIYNATRGGKLEAFERVDFDKIWRER